MESYPRALAIPFPLPAAILQLFDRSQEVCIYATANTQTFVWSRGIALSQLLVMKDWCSHISHSRKGMSSLLIEHSWGNTPTPLHRFIHNCSIFCWSRFFLMVFPDATEGSLNVSAYLFSHASQPKAISILLWASRTHTGSSKSVPFPPVVHFSGR